ncbi:nitroreductase family protein [Odoribacter sp. OttesenSCG-928-J03]|nr:nitroreductase family protein [Odoribacter sp. OttesenSCG-928-J03]
MSISLAINNNTCIQCGKCVKICPAAIFTQEKAGSSVELIHIDDCIQCGHCVAVCPTASILHSEFPQEKVHAIDPALLPSPEQFMLLCKARRSNRAFSSDPVPMEMLDMILEAAHRAPTASNLQQVEFTLITDPEKLKQIADITVNTFSEVASKLQNVFLKPILKLIMPDVYKLLPRLKRLKEEHLQGNDPILRKATTIIFIHTPTKNRFGCQDANLAYQNGSLMAETLGVSQFYTGFVCNSIKQDKKGRIAKLLGINGTIHAGMALAMPAFKFPNYMDKKEINVNRI